MKDFMRYITAGCIAFTFSCIFYLFCSLLGLFPPFIEQMVVNMLFISIVIMLLIYLIHLLPLDNLFIVRLLELFAVLLVPALAGSTFNMFPFTFSYIFPTLSIGILTYFTVISVVFIGDQASAKRINNVIQKRKTEVFHE